MVSVIGEVNAPKTYPAVSDMKIDDLFYLEELLSMKKETGAVESLLRDGGKLTPDLGGNLTAGEVTGEIIELNAQK